MRVEDLLCGFGDRNRGARGVHNDASGGRGNQLLHAIGLGGIELVRGAGVLISAEDIAAIIGRVADAYQRLLQSGHLLGEVGAVGSGGRGTGALRGDRAGVLDGLNGALQCRIRCLELVCDAAEVGLDLLIGGNVGLRLQDCGDRRPGRPTALGR